DDKVEGEHAQTVWLDTDARGSVPDRRRHARLPATEAGPSGATRASHAPFGLRDEGDAAPVRKLRIQRVFRPFESRDGVARELLRAVRREQQTRWRNRRTRENVMKAVYSGW